MSNVINNVISLGDTNPLEPNESLVEMLEELLKHAKRGDIRSVVYVAITDTDSVMTGKIIDDGASIFEVVGAVQYLVYRIIREHID